MTGQVGKVKEPKKIIVIGAGIGGGNWDEIKAELENFALEEDVTIVLWENEP